MFAYVGGHIWSLEEDGPDGHAQTVLSVEIEYGHEPFVVNAGRPLKRDEVQELLSVVSRVLLAHSPLPTKS